MNLRAVATGLLLLSALVAGCRAAPAARRTAPQPAPQPGRRLLPLTHEAATLDFKGPGGRTGMHVAAKWDDTAALARLMKRDMSVDVRDDNGATPLFEAAQYARLGAVRWLLGHGADVNAQGKAGLTALLLASRDSRPADRTNDPSPGPQTTTALNDVAALLLDRGANPDRAMSDGQTPLHNAAGTGNAWLVRRLIDAGAHVDVRARARGTPLRAAAEAGSAEVVRMLFDAGAHPRPPDPQERVFLMAAAARFPDVLQVLLDMLADATTTRVGPAGPGDVGLGSAARSLQPRSVRMLLEAGVTTERTLNGALLAAVDQPRRERGTARPIETDERRARRLEVVTLLLDAGAPADGPDHSGAALARAAMHGYEPVVALLRERGATVKFPDTEETRRNWFAMAFWDEREEVAGLVGLGIKPDIHAAAAFGYADRVREILRADPAAANRPPAGASPLMFAAKGGYLDVVNALLEAGAEVNPKFEPGGWFATAPLEAAVARGHLGVIRRLIEAGADVNFRDAQGRTLLKHVLEGDSSDSAFRPGPAVAELLRSHGAIE
jgi:ankyrin repeat protein